MEPSELVAAVDILDYISQYAEFEEKDGEFWCLSPLKEENTPSFSIDREQQLFYDFSSGVGGDVLTFIQHYNHCGFAKSVAILKKFAGITDEEGAGEQTRSQLLPATKVIRKYKRTDRKPKQSKSKPLPSDLMSRYDLAPEKLQVWVDEGISTEVMERFQVRFDPISNRIVFPIRDPHGNIINICGRTLDPEFKEKKLRKYTYFYPLGTLDTLFGFSENMEAILEKREIILFEGSKSVMLAATWGVENTCAVLTSHLNHNQMELLIGLGVRVVCALDEEVDPRKDKNLRKLSRFVRMETIADKEHLLEEKMAPVDAGPDIWRHLYERRVPY